jgi:hypothetical protein
MDCQLVGDEAPLRPEVWLPWVQRAVRRIDSTQDRAEIESLAVLLMFLYLRAGRNVRNLAGIARAIVRTALGRTRRRRDVRGLRYDFDPDRVAREVDPAGMEPDEGAESKSAQPSPHPDLGLSGSRQKWIVAQVLAGSTLAQMAEAAGCTEREMRRQILAIARKVLDAGCLSASQGSGSEEFSD